MNSKQLSEQIFKKKSFLCVGLDADLNKIPKFFLDFDDPILQFNKAIIKATSNHAIAYKPNLAFYEALGDKGFEILRKTIEFIPRNIFTIADAKRGDIGNTAEQYAKTFFEYFNFDAITLSPYMGIETVSPFLEYPNKMAIVLALTSNMGALDFQYVNENGSSLFEIVVQKFNASFSSDNLAFVVGATKTADLEKIRRVAPDNFLLVPGVGAQGGDLDEVIQLGKNKNGGLMINVSRALIYPNNPTPENFEMQVADLAQNYQNQMHKYFE